MCYLDGASDCAGLVAGEEYSVAVGVGEADDLSGCPFVYTACASWGDCC